MRKVYSNDELRAMFLDRDWLFILPDQTRREHLRRNSFYSSMFVRLLHEKKHESRHGALVDNDSQIHPGFFVWNPAPSLRAGLVEGEPLLSLSPKEFYRRDQPTLYPDLSSLQLENNPINVIGALGTTFERRIPIPPSRGQHHPFTHRVPWSEERSKKSMMNPEKGDEGDYYYQDAFLMIPHPLPIMDELRDECERLCNLRSIDIEVAWDQLHRESKNDDRWTSATLRIRKTLLEVVSNLLPQTVAFAMDFKDADGKVV